MKKQNLLKQKGITLIALIISIIVMLILVAVTISMAINGGLFGYAGNAARETQDAKDKESGYFAGLLGNKTVEELIGAEEQEEINSVETSNPDADIKIKVSIIGTKVNNPVIPQGFRYKEGSIQDGYVITDGTNEFVWIPVDKDQKISLQVTANENISTIKIYNPDGTPVSFSATGTSYENNEITPTTNGAYIVTATTQSGKAAVKLLEVYSLYANTLTIVTDTALSNFGFSSVEQAEQQFEAYGANVDMAMGQFFQQISNDSRYQDTADYSSSVANYGGFYIGRYEAGAPTYRSSGNSSATVTDIITANGKPVCSANQTPYNFITRSQAKGLAEEMYKGKSFTCTLLTGSAWDRTIGFLAEEGTNNKTKAQIYENSGAWGNYNDVSFNVTNTSAKYSENEGSTYNTISSSYTKPLNESRLLTTGATNRNSAKNIYDLAGNVWEWVLQKCGDEYPVVSRGCSCSNDGDNTVNLYLTSSTDFYYDTVGFRPALYL